MKCYLCGRKFKNPHIEMMIRGKNRKVHKVCKMLYESSKSGGKLN